MDEKVIIVDENDVPLGIQTRSHMRANNLIHRASYILVFNNNAELYVQKRTATKDVYPGFFDLAAGGVVLKGETYEEAAVRELFEELGIRGDSLSYVFDNYYGDQHCRVWGKVYTIVFDGRIRHQIEEVESGVFVSKYKVLDKIPINRITPDTLEIYRRFLAEEK